MQIYYFDPMDVFVSKNCYIEVLWPNNMANRYQPNSNRSHTDIKDKKTWFETMEPERYR